MLNDLEPLAPFGADERVVTLLRSSLEPAHVPGRVVRVDRDRCIVVGPLGTEPAFANPLPAVGDWVGLVPAVAETGTPASVAVVLARRSELRRGEQVVAANVDVVFVVTGLDREPNLNRLERELALAWDSGARPVVVLNKRDRVDDFEAVAGGIRSRLGSVDVVPVSGQSGDGVASLADVLRPAATGVFVGASGVGKSTLMNRLTDGPVASVGPVRESDRKGRHTTTSRSLVLVPSGGVLIDTPGVRSLRLGDAGDGVTLGFPEIEELGRGCRFRDCSHDVEPGCAVLAAVDAGELGSERFASWQKLSREAALEARNADSAEARRRPGGGRPSTSR